MYFSAYLREIKANKARRQDPEQFSPQSLTAPPDNQDSIRKHSVCMTTALAGKPSPQCRLLAEKKGSDNVVDADENRFCIDAESGRSATLPEVQT